MCKDLMWARLAARPAVFAPAELDAWGIAAGTPAHPAWRYLKSAANKLGRLLDEFAPEYEPNSLGNPADETHEERAIRWCVDLVGWDGQGRPDACLYRIAAQVRRDPAVEWWTRCWWDGLAELRDQLNLLPEAEGPRRQRLPLGGSPWTANQFSR